MSLCNRRAFVRKFANLITPTNGAFSRYSTLRICSTTENNIHTGYLTTSSNSNFDSNSILFTPKRYIRHKANRKSGPQHYRFGNYSRIIPTSLNLNSKPTPQDPSLELVPSHIGRPVYSRTGIPSTDFNTSFADTFAPLSESDLLKLKHSCKLAADTLRYSGTLVKEGVTTLEIDTLVRKFIIENEAYPSPLNYYGFPKSICTSINNIVAHGIPDKRKLMDGDIINIDISVYCNGFHGDTSATFCVGNVDQQGLALVEATKKALDIGMNVCGPEVELRQIGNSIENYANEAGYSVNDQYTGHGIGKEFHQNPLIYHFKNDEPGVMKEGMVFTIEPMLNQGTKECIIFPDGWTISTCDGSRSAQFEHTIIITSNGYEILTV